MTAILVSDRNPDFALGAFFSTEEKASEYLADNNLTDFHVESLNQENEMHHSEMNSDQAVDAIVKMMNDDFTDTITDVKLWDQDPFDETVSASVIGRDDTVLAYLGAEGLELSYRSDHRKARFVAGRIGTIGELGDKLTEFMKMTAA